MEPGGLQHNESEQRRRQWRQPRQNSRHCGQNHADPAEKLADGDKGQQSPRNGANPLPSWLLFHLFSAKAVTVSRPEECQSEQNLHNP